MLVPGKFAYVFIGAVTLIGAALIPAPDPTDPSAAQSALVDAGNEFSQTAFNQIDLVYREASAEISPRLQSLPYTADAFVRSNATTARLQFEGMANALPSFTDFAARLPGTAAYWIQGGVPGAIQNSRAEADTLAGKIPAVNAWKMDLDHLANLHPALNGGRPSF